MKFAVLAGILIALIAVFMYFSYTDTVTDDVTEHTATAEDIANDVEQTEAGDESVPETEMSENEESATEDDESGTENEERVFNLDSFMYGYSQEEIVVNVGDTVTINLTNSEGLHDWVVDELDVATEIISAGEETSVTFVADQAGEFEFYCSVGNHRAQGMVGTLIVQ